MADVSDENVCIDSTIKLYKLLLSNCFNRGAKVSKPELRFGHLCPSTTKLYQLLVVLSR